MKLIQSISVVRVAAKLFADARKAINQDCVLARIFSSEDALFPSIKRDSDTLLRRYFRHASIYGNFVALVYN